MAKRTTATSKASTKKASASVTAPVAQPEGTPTKSAPASVAKAVATPKAAKPVVTRDMIAKRAYEIWERKGRPIGKDLENWQEAERELGVR